MMVSIQKDPSTQVVAQTYRLMFPRDERPFVYLEDAAGRRLADLFVLSSAHAVHGQDDTTELGEWTFTEDGPDVICERQAGSSVWSKKTIRFRCQPTRLVYEVEIEGDGRLTDVDVFGGYYSGNLRWGSGYFWSGMKAQQGFNPEPNCDEIFYFSPAETSVIDMTGVPIPGKGDWFFTPPPYCFSFRGEDGWFSMAVEAAPGENRFTEYRYQGQQFGFHLRLPYEGHTAVSGLYALPSITFDFADSEYAVLERHVSALYARGWTQAAAPVRGDWLSLAGGVSNARDRAVPAWWQEPIFCGWGSQCYEASLVKGHAPDFSRQTLYEQFLETLDQHEIHPRIVVLDDKWQASYGINDVDVEKWPNLRGFADRLHARGQKMLLWLKAWDPEGVPAEECVVNAAGRKVSVDPTNPAYEARLRAAVRRMLSPEGDDADGFKIDFSARIPSGPGLRKHGWQWGLELMKQYLWLLYDEAKRVKPDALIMAHTPHPYLADVIDMIRLNDVNVATDINPAMIHRARVARIACPHAIIDTDNWPMPNKAAWRRYVAIQPELGVPSLYFASHVDATGEPLTAEDYELIRTAWRRYAESRAAE